MVSVNGKPSARGKERGGKNESVVKNEKDYLARVERVKIGSDHVTMAARRERPTCVAIAVLLLQLTGKCESVPHRDNAPGISSAGGISRVVFPRDRWRAVPFAAPRCMKRKRER